RVLEMMASVGYRTEHPVAKRAIEWLKRNQSPAGGWWGRWGINYIYGTFSALSGLRAIGVDINEPWIKRAVQWLKSKQNPDGGWGESPLSDKDPAWHGRGNSTASQTAWALIGLIAGESGISEPAARSGSQSGRTMRARGTRGNRPAPDFRIIFIFATTCTRITFR